MLPGPIFRREVKASAAARRAFRARVLLAAVIAVLVLIPAWLALGPDDFALREAGLDRPAASRLFWSAAAGIAIAVEVLIFSVLAASAVGASIAEEREKDTLPLLLLTRLTRFELAATKLAGRIMPVFLLMPLGLPMILAGAWIADLPALLIVEALAVLASTAIVAGSLGILTSSRHDRSGAAIGEAVGWTMLWLVGMPVVALMPVRSGTLWGDLLVELRRIAGWLAPSSPVSLLTDLSWYTGRSDAPGLLSDQLLTMLAMQAAIVVAAMAGALAGLRLREPHASSLDPHQGYRPPVGDDPIYWREFELLWRNFRGPIAVAMVRRLLIVLRTLLVLVLQAISLATAMAILIGLVVATGWFAYHAFRETWGSAISWTRPLGARADFNFFIRFATFFLGQMPMSGAATVAAQITIEREKKTWESLLLTPMTGPEILSSKRRVVARMLWSACRWLIPLWLLGIVCGALHPLGVVLAALGVVAGIRLGLAIGMRAAIRPGATMQSANSVVGNWYIAMLLVGGLTVIAPLGTARELEALRSYDARLPWAVVFGLLAMAIAMIAWERSLTRRCFERFDEWVGRPHRAGDAERSSGAPAAPGPVPVATLGDGSRTPSAIAVE